MGPEKNSFEKWFDINFKTGKAILCSVSLQYSLVKTLLKIEYLDLWEFIRSVNIIPRRFLEKIGQLVDKPLSYWNFLWEKEKKELKQDLVTPRKRKRNYIKKKTNQIFLFILACDITIELAFFPFSNIWVPVNRGRSKESEDTVWFDSTSVSSTYQVTS